MICLKCGCESPEGARFCKKCGADLNGQTEETSFTASSGMANTDGAPGYEKDETRHEMKKLMTSPLVLIAAILLCVSIVVSVVSVFSPVNADGIFTLIEDEMENIGQTMGEEEYEQMIEGLDTAKEYIGLAVSVTRGVSIAGQVPYLFLMIGLWLIYSAGRKWREGVPMNTIGFTFVRVILTIVFVISIVGLGSAILLLGLAAVLLAVGSMEGILAAGIMLFFLLVIVGILVLYIFYYKGLIRTVKVMRETAESGVPNAQISMFSTVFLIVTCGLSVLNGLGAILLLSGFSSMLRTVSELLLAIAALAYRNRMKALIAPAAPEYL